MKARDIVIIVVVVIILAIVLFFVLRNNNNLSDETVPDENANRYLVLRAYNKEGGFMWHIYNLLCASHEARKRNMTLVVLFDSGLYREDNPIYKEKYKQYLNNDNNWFEYHYYPIGTDIPEIRALMDQGKLNADTKIRSLSKYDSDTQKRKFYEFDRSMFNVRDMNVNYGHEWQECIRIKPHIQYKIDEFYDKNMDGYLTIAVHRRGTDKYPSHSDSEDHPEMIEYEWIADKIQNWIDNESDKVNKKNFPIKILVCSDEQPFVDFMKSKFKDKVVFTNSIRSDASTSGKHLQTCRSENDNSPDCIEYKKMKDVSIHKGMRHLSSYQKGEDAVIDVELMSLCNGVFFKSRGNFSSAVTYANPSLPAIDMVNDYKKNPE